MTRVRSQRGLSVLELMAVTAVIATLALVAALPLVEAVRNSRLRAASRQLAGDVRYARSKATSTGWQYRIAGVSAGAGSAQGNRYRLMARAASGTAWPDTSTAALESPTLIVAAWVDLDTLYPGVEINPVDTGEFGVTFDSRGSPIEVSLNFNPMEITNEAGDARWVTVSAVGSVRVD